MRKIHTPDKICEGCGNAYSRGRIAPSQFANSRFCSIKCIFGVIKNSGEQNPNYRGGKTKCRDCGIELAARYSRKRMSSRCMPCYRKWVREDPRNHPRWSGGFPDCIQCGVKTKDRNSKYCRKCARGKNLPHWKGGISRLAARIRVLPENRRWVLRVFFRDDFICQICDAKGVKVEADHIKPFAVILRENRVTSLKKAKACQELWDITNGRTLCKPCHRKTDSFGKKNFHMS